jgi:two-component system sensor histidine kinase YesM
LFFHKELHKEYDLSYVADAFIFYDIAPSLEKVDQQIQQNNGIVQILTDDNQEVAVSSNTNELESFHTLDSLKVNNYVTRVMTKKSNVFTEYSTIYFLYFICIGLIVMLSFPFIFKNFVNLEKRILKVNDKLSDIRNGNFETRYIDQKDNSENSDEISLISLSIDEIAHQLNEHVTQVYKSKLKQKDYQIQSIRAQINPHFLYNTLEAIRMKAVLNDDDAVAGMLLNAASLYRNMIKGDDIVLLKDEIDFCDDYLSLFEARFEDNLFYDISYDESLDDVLIEKFSIQPIIENYIHHGIDSKRNDNFIEIHCYKNKDELLIQVTNNGKPIAKTDLVDINNQLKNNHKNNEEKTLTGLFGVDFRLKQRFGDEYGVSIENRVNSVVVTLKLPIKRGYKNESTSS